MEQLDWDWGFKNWGLWGGKEGRIPLKSKETPRQQKKLWVGSELIQMGELRAKNVIRCSEVRETRSLNKHCARRHSNEKIKGWMKRKSARNWWWGRSIAAHRDGYIIRYTSIEKQLIQLYGSWCLVKEFILQKVWCLSDKSLGNIEFHSFIQYSVWRQVQSLL
jgi:hypothetical protein